MGKLLALIKNTAINTKNVHIVCVDVCKEANHLGFVEGSVIPQWVLANIHVKTRCGLSRSCMLKVFQGTVGSWHGRVRVDARCR